MRVLFACIPGFGHFHPMVPLARAVAEAGHDTAFATAERFCRRVVEPAGFRAFSAGLSPIAVQERITEPAGRADVDAWRFGAHMFAGVAAPAKVADLVRAIRDWGADLLVHDMTDFAGPVAAAACRIPWVNHSFGALQPAEFWDLAAQAVAPTWEEWGLEPPPDAGMFRWRYLDVCPPGLQTTRSEVLERVGARARPLRPVPFDDLAGTDLPAWLDDAAGPIVYVTLGTVANHAPGVFETVLAGLAGHPGSVIVTIGPDRDPGELPAPAANVHVVPYLPHSRLLPRCDVVVCHGGSGTTLATLGFGLPLLVLPQEANQFWNAERVAALGAGLRLTAEQLTADAVATGVARLLDDPAHRRQAEALARQIGAMAGPEEHVAGLEALSEAAGDGEVGSPDR